MKEEETNQKKRRRTVPYKWRKTKNNVFENIIAGYDRYNMVHKIEKDLNDEALIYE
jgi:hypothetical protein